MGGRKAEQQKSKFWLPKLAIECSLAWSSHSRRNCCAELCFCHNSIGCNELSPGPTRLLRVVKSLRGLHSAEDPQEFTVYSQGGRTLWGKPGKSPCCDLCSRVRPGGKAGLFWYQQCKICECGNDGAYSPCHVAPKCKWKPFYLG